jgi:membrane fusion protein, multidrug efflux system
MKPSAIPPPAPVRAALLVLLALATAAAAQGRPRSGEPLRAELHTVEKEEFARTITTIGTLRANESVVLLPELSRRLTGILVEEGASVDADEVLFQLDDADLRAGLAELEARIRLATLNRDRAANLLPNKAISRQEFDLAAAEVEILEAQKIAREVELAKTSIRAPFAGRTGVRQVSAGALVSPTTPLVTVQDISSIKIDFSLPERHAPELRTGLPFTFTVAGKSQTFSGEVIVIEPAIDELTRSLRVRGHCKDPGGLLPGGFADVTLTLEGAGEGFLIPSQALVPSPRGQGVYVIVAGQAQLRPVETGIRTADRVQVLRGLEAGERIAITNLLRLRPGLAVLPADVPAGS